MRRIFFALEVSEPARATLAGVVEALRASESAARMRPRFTHHEDWHATLKFVGNVEDEVALALIERAKQLTLPALPLASSWAGLGAFPSESRARVLVGHATDPAGEVEKLSQTFENLCAASGVRRETRPYRPHVTLARLRFPQDVHQLCKIPLAGHLTLGPVVLYESLLSSEGSRYLPIWRSA